MSARQEQIIRRMADETYRTLLFRQRMDEGRIAGRYRDAADLIKARLLDFTDEEWKAQSPYQVGRWVSLFAEVKRILGEAEADTLAELETILGDQWRDAYFRTGWQLDTGTPRSVEISLHKIPEDQVRAMLATPHQAGMYSQRIGRITTDTALRIQDELATAMILGEDLRTAAKRVDTATGMGTTRAKRIARTEISRARELARASVFTQNADVIQDAVWVAFTGKCPICRDLDGKKASPARGGFYSDVTPDKVYTDPPAHPNCRCTLRAIVDGWDELAGKDDPDPEYQTFGRWVDRQQKKDEASGMAVESAANR